MGQGITVANAFTFACLALRNNIDAINSLNVFPVPDGDTGTNMFLTMQAATEHLGGQYNKPEEPTVVEVLSLIASGALIGARGNSGVLLSQYLQGLAGGYADSIQRSVKNSMEVDPEALCAAFSCGTDMAYSAVSEPVEGTMLTVMRGISDRARETYQSGGYGVLAILEECVAAANATLQATPDMLATLREAGVVDAGGQGMVVILDAVREYFSAEDLDDKVSIAALPIPEVHGVSPLQWHIDSGSGGRYGYCTEFVIVGQNIDKVQLRMEIEANGDSAIVVGDSSMARIHVHTDDPGKMLSIGVSVGRLSKITIDDMDQQYAKTQTEEGTQGNLLVGVVAIGWGSGIVELFESLGAAVVVCGDTMNPSTKEIIDAIEHLGAESTVILPNNPNVILTAKQAQSQLGRAVRIVETTTIPAGVSAVLSYDSEAGVDTNVKVMSDAAVSVKAGGVARSVRDIVIDGVECKIGDVLGMLDETIVIAGEGELRSLEVILDRANVQPGDLVTIYRGSDVSMEDAAQLRDSLETEFLGTTIEMVYGGQPRYAYLIGIE
jgi:DAK2 domain fusion protein YloV